MTRTHTVSHDPMTRPDNEQLAAWRTFLGAHVAVIERIERDLAAAGRLPLGSYDVLFALAEAPDHRLRMGDLAAAVLLNRSTLTRRVDRLEREGLLTRERFAADKRGAHAVLTQAGMEALRRAWPIYAHGIATYFAQHLSPQEIRVMQEALSKVVDAARAEGKESSS